VRSKVKFTRLLDAIKYAAPTLAVAAYRRLSVPARPLGTSLKILVVRLDGIGDFILFTPFLRELRRNYPDSKITLVVIQSVAPLAMPCPYVNEVLVLNPGPADKAISRNLKKSVEFARYVGYLVDFADRLLAGRFDLAIQPRWDVDSQLATLITVLSRAPRTVGYSEKTSPEKSWCNIGYNHLLTDVLPPGPEQHEAERSLDIIRHLGGSVESTAPEIWWSAEERIHADRFLVKSRLSGDERLIAFGVGASSPRRQWPFYCELIRLLAPDLNFVPLILAGPGEERLARQIADVSSAAVLMQQMPLGVVAAVLSRCALFVGNDSGPMHLASAVGLPVVEISCHPIGGDPGHVNSPDRLGPVAQQKAIVRPTMFSENCKGGCCEDIPHCITTITPEEVASQVMQLLASIKTPA